MQEQKAPVSDSDVYKEQPPEYENLKFEPLDGWGDTYMENVSPMATKYDVSLFPSMLLSSSLDLDCSAGTKIVARNDMLYVACNHGSIKVVDISDPQTPKLINDIETSGFPVDSKLVGNNLYVLEHELSGRFHSPGVDYEIEERKDVLEIYDVSSPKNPRLINALEFKAGDYGFGSGGVIEFFDIDG